MNCPKCNSVISDNSKFCTYCGTKIEQIVVSTPGTAAASVCIKCGAPLRPGVKFCSKCGASQTVQPAQSVPQPSQNAQPQPAVQPSQTVQQPQPAVQPSQTVQQPQPAVQPSQDMQQPQPAVQPSQTVQQPQPAVQPSQTVQQPQPTAQPSQDMQQPQPAVQPSQNVQQPAAQLTQSTPQSMPQSQPTVQLAQSMPQTSQSMPQSQPTVLLAQSAPQAAPQPSQSAPQPAQNVPQPPIPPQPPQKQKPAKKSKVPIVLAVVFVLLVAFAVGGYFVLVNVFDVDPVAMITGNEKEDSEDTEDTEENSGEEEDDVLAKEEEEEQEEEEKKGDPALLDALDPQAEAVRKLFDEMSYIAAIDASRDVIQQYVTIGEENNLTEEAEEKIQSVFDIASMSAIESCKGIERQECGSAGFEQVTSTLGGVLELASSLAEKGYTIDSAEITEYNDGVAQRFKDSFIKQINSITEREQWSRDEAWTYAEQAYSIQKDGKVLLFEDDPDDPLRLRYAYCLAWITRKRCENGVADGSMTNEDAFNASVAILQETDYNLLVLQDVIAYGNAAKKDVSGYQAAYNAIIQELKEEQNLSIVNSGVNSATSVDIRKFWYFNDLDGDDAYKVDIYNGTTQATRDWIRSNIPSYIN